MNKHIKYAIKLKWSEVASIISEIITSQLGRNVVCKASCEDYNYWTASTVESDTFTIQELEILLKFVNADLNTRYECLPADSETSRSIGMSVSETLLSISLETSWEHFSVCADGLWLAGIEDISTISKYLCKRGAKHD